METIENKISPTSGEYSIETHNPENVGFNERLASMLLGGILLGSSLKNPFKSRFMYGLYLAYRGISGNCLFYEYLGIDGKKPQAVNIKGEFEIDLPPAEVYAYWRNLKNLPGTISRLLNVEVVDENHSTWKSKILGNLFAVKWDAEIVKDEPGRLIGWKSSNNKLMHHVGRVEFEQSPNNGATLMRVVLSYRPLIGGVGVGLSKLINPYFEHLLEKEIKSFKYRIEHKTPVNVSPLRSHISGAHSYNDSH
ncbi:SRPBCC family protein [Pedobacter sp.]|uniref:SRPBCC family protein n=1 Tax=Pedobacter sp. TaxID=1411316 RepID=UPI003D7F7286